jgi:protein-S-isoprenylcysteine O-methyltransferase Ste14
MSEKQIWWRMLWAGDLLGRIGVIAYFSHASAAKIAQIYTALVNWPELAMDHKLLWLLSEFALLSFLFLIVSTTIFRLKPILSAEGIEPRLTALAGTFLLGLLAHTPPAAPVAPAVVALAFGLIAAGFLLSAYVLVWLGRSFSIMAEARRLVTSGPYAIVRHPLYLTEELAVIGVIILNFSLAAALLGIVHWALQLRRMYNEERVLRAAFPDYEGYAGVTPKIIPRLFTPLQRPV